MKKPSLANCTESELLRFRHDHATVGDYGLFTDSVVVAISSRLDADIEIPRAVFNRLIYEYQKPRKFVRKPIKL